MRVEHVDVEYAGRVYEDNYVFDLSQIFSIQSDTTDQVVPDTAAPRTPVPSGTLEETPDRSLPHSPFSLSRSLHTSSPITSPHSSTPISGNVSFTKSFETPSMHSPIISDTSDSLLSNNNKCMSSDTLLSWSTRLETPPRRHIHTPPRTSPLKQVLTKKLFASSPESKSKPLPSATGSSAEATSSPHAMSCANVLEANKSPNNPTDADQNDGDLNMTKSPIGKPPPVNDHTDQSDHLNPNIIIESDFKEMKDTPVTSAETTKPIIPPDAGNSDNPIIPADVKPKNSNDGSMCDMDIAVDSLPIFSQNNLTVLPSEATKEHSKFKYPPATQHLPTQRHSLQEISKKAPAGEEAMLMSQWSEEVYDMIDQIAREQGTGSASTGASSSTRIDTEATNKTFDAKSEAVKKNDKSVEKQEQGPVEDSFPMSQWDNEALKHLETVITNVPESDEPVDKEAIKEHIINKDYKEQIPKAKSKLDLFEELYFKEQVKAVPGANAFNEDFSDLKMCNLPGFALASESATAGARTQLNPPQTSSTPEILNRKSESKLAKFDKFLADNGQSAGKERGRDVLELSKADTDISINNPKSFFNEDFSDLDLTKVTAGVGGGFSKAGTFLTVSAKISDVAGDEKKSSNIITPKLPTPVVKFEGFSTAAGKAVVVSKQSLDHIRSSQIPFDRQMKTHIKGKDFCEEDFTDLELDAIPVDALGSSQVAEPIKKQISNMPPRWSGFSTAAGSKVDVSDKSLNYIRSSQLPVDSDRTKKVLTVPQAQDVKLPENVGTGHGGFCTGLGNKVSVAKQSLDYIISTQVPVNTQQQQPLSKSKADPDHSDKLSISTPVTVGTTAVTTGTTTLKASSNKENHLSSLNTGLKRARIDTTPARISKLSRSRANTASPKTNTSPAIVERVRRKSSDPHLSPLSSNFNKRRKRGGVAFNSPVTDKTTDKRRVMTSSPISHYIRPGFSPLLSSPQLESTLEEGTAEQTSFVTPYNKAPAVADKTQKMEEKNRCSVMWRHDLNKLNTKHFVNPSSEGVAKRPLRSLPAPAHHSKEVLYELGVPDCLFSISPDNAAQFRFCRPHFFTHPTDLHVKLADSDTTLHLAEDFSAGYLEFYAAICRISSVKQTHLSRDWVANHYRLVVWKCAGQEKSHPAVYAGRALSPRNIMKQLLTRYWIEVEEGRRSALRLITEKDDTASKPLTLCVVGVNTASNTLEVTDGWYCLECTLDRPLTVLLQRRALTVGAKIVSFSSNVIGPHSDGIPPLEARTVLKLHLNYNAVRPAAWHAPLGYTRLTTAPTLPIRTLAPEGGPCVCLQLVVVRRYPVQYMETLPGGKKLFHCQKVETRREEEHNRKKEKLLGEIENRIWRESEAERRAEKRVSVKHIRSLQTGEELYRAVAVHADPGSVHCVLSSTQREVLAEYTAKYQHTQRENNNKEVLSEIAEKCPARKVLTLVKYKVHCHHGDLACSQVHADYYLTVWRADKLEPLKEGRAYKLYNVATSSYGGRGVSLSTLKNTQFREIPGNYSHLAHKPLCSVSKIPEKTRECDVFGRVLQVTQTSRDLTHPTHSKQVSTEFVLADESAAKRVIVYGDIQELGLADTIKAKNTISIQNLQINRTSANHSAVRRSRDRTSALYVNEKCVVSSYPRDNRIQEQLKVFKANISNRGAGFWEGLLANIDQNVKTTVTLPADTTDELDVPPDDIQVTDDPFQTSPTALQTPAACIPAQSSALQTPAAGIPAQSSTVLTPPAIPLFSVGKGFGEEGEFGELSTLDVSCTDSARREYVTPVKSRDPDYESIFQ